MNCILNAKYIIDLNDYKHQNQVSKDGFKYDYKSWVTVSNGIPI